MLRSLPLKRKRETPRRKDPSRCPQPRRKPGQTAEEKRHELRLREMPCINCGARPVSIHHVTATIHGGRLRRSERRIVPLCPACHQHDFGKLSVERLGHGGFYRVHGVDLYAESDRLWKESFDA